MSYNLKTFHPVIPVCIYVTDKVDFVDVVDSNTIVSEITSMARLTSAKFTVHNKRQDSRIPTVGPEAQYIELLQAAHKLLTIFDW